MRQGMRRLSLESMETSRPARVQLAFAHPQRHTLDFRKSRVACIRLLEPYEDLMKTVHPRMACFSNPERACSGHSSELGIVTGYLVKGQKPEGGPCGAAFRTVEWLGFD
jgi:hypothetical protein